MTDAHAIATTAPAPPGEELARQRGRILRYIRHLVRDPQEAEDLTQETLLRAHAQRASLRDPAALPFWLYRIATTVSTDRLRQTARLRALVPPRAVGDPDPERLPASDLDAPDVLEALERSEMSACVEEFVQRLPDRYRAVILLHDLQGLTGPEAAAVLDCTLDTVKIRLHRARARLKAALQAGCDFSHDRRGVFVCGRKCAAQ